MTFDYGLTLVDESSLFSRLVKFNREDGTSIKDSPVTTIRNRTVYKTDAGLVAVCGENINNGSVKLVTIDPDTMEITNESNETISETSVLIQDSSSDNDFYCVFMDGNEAFLGKYGSDLKLKLRSNISVKAATPITLTDTGVVITASNGLFTVLSKGTLEPLK